MVRDKAKSEILGDRDNTYIAIHLIQNHFLFYQSCNCSLKITVTTKHLELPAALWIQWVVESTLLITSTCMEAWNWYL